MEGLPHFSVSNDLANGLSRMLGCRGKRITTTMPLTVSETADARTETGKPFMA